MPVKATVIADSISPAGVRLISMEVEFPKFILAEFNTHRMFSRSFSSSRAIPLKKYMDEATSSGRAKPVIWGGEQKGMSPGEVLAPTSAEAADNLWAAAAQRAASYANALSIIGAHKSLCNRLLDPFIHARGIVTSTEWLNFFGLRLHEAADPTMRALAEEMWRAGQESQPKELRPGEWHLPYVSDEDKDTGGIYGLDQAIKVSVARCARVSYKSNDTGRRSTIDEDLALYERLVGSSPKHASPAEHQATPDHKLSGEAAKLGWANDHQHGNFHGWRQYRKMLPEENMAPLPEGYTP